MKIAFTTLGLGWDSMMEPRFGRTDYLLVYDEKTESFSSYDNRINQNEEHGAGPKMAKVILDLGIDVLITGNGPGGNASAVLSKGNVKIYVGAGEMQVKDAYEAYKADKLTRI